MSEETKKYIKKYFKLEFLVCYDSLNDTKNNGELEKIVAGIGTVVSKKYKTKDVILGKADRLIHRLIVETMQKRFPNRYSSYINSKRYIENHIRNSFFVDYSDKSLGYIADKIALRIGSLVDYDKLMIGDDKIDSQISFQYEFVYKDTINSVHKYAKNYLIRNVYPMIDVDEVAVANDVVTKIMNDDKYNVIDLFTKKYDGMIEQMAYANRRENERNKPDSLRYILVYIIKELDDYLDYDELINLSMAIDATLRERGSNTKEILSHLCDDQIAKMYNLYMMKKNSVYEEDKPKRVKYNPISKKIKKEIVTILIAVSLVFASGGAVYMVGHELSNGVNQVMADWRYNFVSQQMSGSKYQYIYTKYNDGYLENMNLVVDDYNKYSGLGETYGYLGFYEAYKHMNSDSLAIMDSFLKDLSYKIYCDKYETDMKITSTCFLEFVYDRLVDMGCEEIQKEEYLNAVKEYKRVASNNFDSKKTTMDCIEEKDEGLTDTIRNMMKMYHQYSSKCYEELSEIYVPSETKGRS